MAEYMAPGVYVEEFDSGLKSMEGVGTSTGGFIGMAERGPVGGKPVLLTSFADYLRTFGGYLPEEPYGDKRFLPYAVDRYFANGGSGCYVMRVPPKGSKCAAGTAVLRLGELPEKEEDPVKCIQFSFAACDLGKAGNEISVAVEVMQKARSAVLEQQEGKLLRLKNAGQFVPGDAVTFLATVTDADGEEPRLVTARAVVDAKNGDWVTLRAPLCYEAPDEPAVETNRENSAGENNGQNEQTAGAAEADAVRLVALPGASLVDLSPVPDKALVALGFRVTVTPPGGEKPEVFENVSLDPESSAFLPELLRQSRWITASGVTADIAKNKLPSNVTTAEEIAAGQALRLFLTAGADGDPANTDMSAYTGTDGGPGRRTGLKAFLELSDVNIMAMPGITDQGALLELTSHCEQKSDRFAVLDCPFTASSVDDLKTYRGVFDTTYAALYHPWLQFYDPQMKTNKFFPPSGAVAGIYARVDNQRGVHKAPANETVAGCTGLSVTYNATEQGFLNPAGINLIRTFPGQGIRVWGARTVSSDGSWKYVNVRRLFIYLESSILANTSWAVFEPNDQGLWSRVESTIRAFLTTTWRNGALMGATPDEAFYVKVGASTMTQDDILNGRLICEIGVAPVRPAEFVIFRITQKMEEA